MVDENPANPSELVEIRVSFITDKQIETANTLRLSIVCLRDSVKDLTAERDELQSIIDHMPKTEAECEACQEAHDRLMFNAKVDMDELRGKLREKQHVCDVQRDSFLKMERECAELRRMLADAAEAI